MTTEAIEILLFSSSFLLLFGSTELLFHYQNWKVEITRKIAHVGTGIITLLFPVFLSSHWSVLFLCSSFLILLTLSMKFDFLKSINAIDRKSYGSILYPISVYFCFYAYTYFGQEILYFYLPILILAICDPIAALAGKKKPFGKYNRGSKSLSGSLGFFVSCTLLSGILLDIFAAFTFSELILYSLAIALVASLVETISGKGFDNLTITLAVVILLFFIL